MRIKALFLFLIFLAFSGSLFSQQEKSLIAQGDELYAQRLDLAKAKEALAKYQDALINGENKYEAYWKMARVEYWIGDKTESNKEKKAIFQQGIYHAKKAVELEPNKVDGHFWLGVNYGVYGEAKGVLKSLFLVKPIKQEMNKVLELDRTYESGGADRVLGRVYFKLPGFAGGDNKKSLEHLLKSKELGLNDGLTRIYLADTYLALDQVEKAREELEYVLKMEPDENDPSSIAELPGQKEDARKMLEKKDFRKK